MKLVIISHTPHHRAAAGGQDVHTGQAARIGQIAGWGPTIREIDQLASLFDEVVHIAPLHDAPAAPIDLPYTSPRVTFRPVLPAGGERFIDKVDILLKAPHYLRVMLEELHDADAVHVRCSAAISLFAIILLGLVHTPAIRWVKYAGDWKPEYRDTWVNRMQRWWISRRLHRGVVTINGQWPDQPTHIYSFVNPCLTAGELAEGRAAAQGKQLSEPLRVLFVGRTESHKGLDTALTVIQRLHDQGVAATLDVVGGGPDRDLFQAQAADLGIAPLVTFYDHQPRHEVAQFYAKAHIILLPSKGEGWPKVLSEAMAHGVVPVASAVGSIGQTLAQARTGRALPPDDVQGFAAALAWYTTHPADWREESERAALAAGLFTYDRYLDAIQEIILAEPMHDSPPRELTPLETPR